MFYVVTDFCVNFYSIFCKFKSFYTILNSHPNFYISTASDNGRKTLKTTRTGQKLTLTGYSHRILGFAWRVWVNFTVRYFRTVFTARHGQDITRTLYEFVFIVSSTLISTLKIFADDVWTFVCPTSRTDLFPLALVLNCQPPGASSRTVHQFHIHTSCVTMKIKNNCQTFLTVKTSTFFFHFCIIPLKVYKTDN